MADWASAAASAFLQVVFQTAANFLAEEVRLMHALPKEIEDLQTNVNMIIATLQVATINPSRRLKIWLDNLRDVGYDAIDLLDEHNTELLRRNLVHAAEVRKKLANPTRFFHDKNMSRKINELSSRMGKVFQTRNDFGFNVNESLPTRHRIETTTSLPPTHVVGREDEMNEILRKLIPYNDVQVGIWAIHGMGRIGKTTLAQSVYKELNKQGDFDMTLWVHVSYEFDIEKVTHSILDSMGERQVRDINLDTAQKLIQMKLEGKRYLLVLDDLSNESTLEWEKLIRPLQKGAPGSVMIVTTCTGWVAEMVSRHSTISPCYLKELSGNDCYSLVAQYASCNNRDATTKLNTLKSEIIKICKGMPEEAIDLGVRLSREHDEEKWNEIIVKWGKGHTCSKESRSIDSMRLRYSRLDPDLKPCLAYCSIIPKGKQFEKDWIVQLWMAQNYIAKQSEKNIEDIDNYFDRLVAHSFFQKTGTSLDKDRYVYRIPDPVHDVVRDISSEECCIFEVGKNNKPAKSTRHISIVSTREQLSCTPNPFTEIYHCKGLYTLLVIVEDSLIYHPLRLPDDLSNSLPRLRTLDLSYCKLDTLPNNIGDLKHLRYLQLRYSNIQELPESIGKLYNLQTLGLRNCLFLRKLPKETRNLQKLLHLDLHLDYLRPNVDHQDLRPIVNQMVSSCEKLESMPPDIGLLTNLQVLSRFVVSTGRHCGLNELRNLNSIQGELSISNLHRVKNSNDAAEANLQEKKHIKRLEFLWRGDGGSHERSKERKKKRTGFRKFEAERKH